MRIGGLNPDSDYAEQARARGAAQRQELGHRGRKATAELPPPRPPVAQDCTCANPWNGGEGRCVHCGKHIAGQVAR